MLERPNVTFSTHLLTNNIRLDIFEKESSPFVVRVSILCGDAVDDGKYRAGIAHFLEHMLVAGTKMFRTKDEIAIFLDQYGGDFSAMTTPERLMITVKVASATYAEQAFVVMAQMLSASLFLQETVEKERRAIIAEYKGRFAKTDQQVHRRFAEQIFHGSAFATPVLGTIEAIEAFDARTAVAYLKTHLVGGRIGVTVGGSLAAGEVVELSERYLGFIPFSKGGRDSMYRSSDVAELFGVEHQVGYIPTNEDIANIKIGFRTPRMYHQNHYAYLLINNVIGTRRGSLLNRILRYDKGLVYSVGSSLTNYTSGGMFAINTACRSEHVLTVIEEVIRFIKEGVFDELTEERVELEKERFLKLSSTINESVADWVEFGTVQSTTNEVRTFDDLVGAVRGLNYQSVREALEEMFRGKNLYVTYSNQFNLDNEIRQILGS